MDIKLHLRQQCRWYTTDIRKLLRFSSLNYEAIFQYPEVCYEWMREMGNVHGGKSQ